MNVTGGGLSFDITANNNNLLSVLEASKRAMQTFTNNGTKGGKDIEDAYKKASMAIEAGFKQVDIVMDTNKAAIEQLKAKLAELGKTMSDAFMQGRDAEYNAAKQAYEDTKRQIEMHQKLYDEAGKLSDELVQQEQQLNKQKDAADRASGSYGTIRTQLRQAREELMKMEQNGQRGTQEYEQQRQKVVSLTQALASANKQAKALANPNRNFQAVIGGLTLMTSGYQAVTGAMGLFAGENEDLQRVMTKLQSVMSITMALQTAYTQLNKNSAFQLVLVAKAKDMLTTATTRLSVALGISTVAAKALMATLTLGLTVAITAVIAIISKMSAKAAEAKKAQEEFNKKIGEAAGKPLEAYVALQAEWNSLTGSMAEKEKWVQDNADKFADLGLQVYSARDAERVLVSQTQDFVKACMAKAKALAAQQTATEKYAEILKKEAEIEAMPNEVTVTQSFGTAGAYKAEYNIQNPAKQKAKRELNEMKAAANKYIELQIAFTKEENAYLAKLGNIGQKTVSGSVDAVQEELNRLQKLYNRAANDTERKRLSKQIEQEQAKLDRISYNRKTTTNSNSGKNRSSNTGASAKKDDPFIKLLEARKAAYEKYNKYISSGDETLRQIAPKEFANILKDGGTYIEYLEKQRDLINEKTSKTATDLHNLSILNDEIAATAKQTALDDFTTSLQNAVDSAETLAAKLEVIAKKRAEIAGQTNSDLKDSENDQLNSVERQLTEDAMQQATELVQAYRESTNARLEEERNFQQKLQALDIAIGKATSDQQREELVEAKETMQQLHNARISSFQELEQLYKEGADNVQTYANKAQQIINKYDKLIKTARIKNDKDTADALEQQRNVELFKATKEYTTFFSDITKMSAATFETVRKNLIIAARKALAQGRLTSDQYKELIEAINEQSDRAYGISTGDGNGLIDKIFGDKTEANFQKILGLFQKGKASAADLQGAMGKVGSSAAASLSTVETIVKTIYQTLNAVTETFDAASEMFDSFGDEKTAETLSNYSSLIGTINEGAMSAFNNFKSGNIAGGIADVVSTPMRVITTLNKIHDKKYEKRIQQHERAVKALSNAYNELAHAINNALGEDSYKLQNQSIQNLRKQNEEIQQMINAEQKKKKTNWDKIADWQEQIAENKRSIDDIINNIAEEITGTTGKDLASKISDVISGAFEDGATNAKAKINNTLNGVIREAVTQALQKQYLEKPLADAVAQLQEDMGFDAEGNGSFDGLTPEEQQRFKDAVSRAAGNFQGAMQVYKDLFKELDDTDPTTLSGAIKGASQESIDLLAGQTNAVRMNQVTALGVFREQLLHLSNMDNQLGVIAGRLSTILDKITAPSGDSLRGQGLTS